MKARPLCAVLGGDGFIGSHLVHGLVGRGFKVRVVDQFNDKRSVNLEQIEDEIEMVDCDLFDRDHFDHSILKNVKYLFHFAVSSTPASSIADPAEEYKNHLSPTIRLFQAAKEMRVCRVLFPSSGGTVYGLRPKCPATEDSVLNPVTPHSIAKVAVEQHLNFLRLQGLDSIVYRIANPYGPGQRGWIQGQGVISVLLRAALLEEPVPIIGGASTVRDYVFVDDVVDAILRSFDEDHRYCVYNVGSGRGTRLQTIIGLVERVTARKVRTAMMTARMGETSKIVLNAGRIRREFGWRPKMSLLQGIRNTWQWIQAVGEQELLRE
jgi:UDP-glucose 4-epimerase